MKLAREELSRRDKIYRDIYGIIALAAVFLALALFFLGCLEARSIYIELTESASGRAGDSVEEVPGF